MKLRIMTKTEARKKNVESVMYDAESKEIKNIEKIDCSQQLQVKKYIKAKVKVENEMKRRQIGMLKIDHKSLKKNIAESIRNKIIL